VIIVLFLGDEFSRYRE